MAVEEPGKREEGSATGIGDKGISDSDGVIVMVVAAEVAAVVVVVVVAAVVVVAVEE